MLKPIPSGTGLSFQQIGNFAYRRTYLYKFTNNNSVFSIRQAGLLSYTIFEDCHCVTFPTPDYRNIVLQGDEKSVFYRIIVLQDDEKIIGISSYRTMKNKLSAPRQKVSKNAPG